MNHPQAVHTPSHKEAADYMFWTGCALATLF
jgi:hypothetical protein